jgi:hypothetical protein
VPIVLLVLYIVLIHTFLSSAEKAQNVIADDAGGGFRYPSTFPNLRLHSMKSFAVQRTNGVSNENPGVTASTTSASTVALRLAHALE